MSYLRQDFQQISSTNAQFGGTSNIDYAEYILYDKRNIFALSNIGMGTSTNYVGPFLIFKNPSDLEDNFPNKKKSLTRLKPQIN